MRTAVLKLSTHILFVGYLMILSAKREYTLGRRLTTYATYDRPHLRPQK
jgi:hypothetical protein